MSTVLCIIKSEMKLQASNEEATIVLDLPLDHPAAKLFPANTKVISKTINNNIQCLSNIPTTPVAVL